MVILLKVIFWTFVVVSLLCCLRMAYNTQLIKTAKHDYKIEEEDAVFVIYMSLPNLLFGKSWHRISDVDTLSTAEIIVEALKRDQDEKKK